MQKKSTELGKRGEEEEWPLPPPQPYPWLLYFSGEGGKNQTFCSISDRTKTYSTSIPALGASRLCTVQHGWCFFFGTRDKSRYVRNLFLWNPYNLNKIIELPPLKTNLKINDCVLSSSPTSNYQVCSIFLFPMLGHIFYYGQLGDEQWTEVDVYKHIVKLQVTSTKEKTYLNNPVYCNGCLYATIFTGFAYVFLEFKTSGLKINSMTPPLILLPMPHPSRGLFQAPRTKLLASNNQLFRIETLHAQGKVIAVAVYTFDSSQRLWEKVESIQDRVFFISTLDSSPFACQAINPETEGGRIYIAQKDSDFVCIYNIQDNSIVISQPFSDLPKERYYSTWFMPDIDIGMIDTVLKEEIGKAHQIREKESICGGAILCLKETETREEDKAALTEYALPLDMVEVISKCLGIFDYLHFRATNRLFRLAAPPVVQCRSSSSNSSSMSISRFDDLPLFVFSEKDKVFTFVHPKHGLNYKYTIDLPPPQVNADGEFSNLKSYCEICYSKDGWLLLAGNTNISFFFNPFTKEVLPIRFGLKSIRNTRCVGFSHPPTSSERVIIELDKFEKYDLMIAHINGHRFFFTDNKFPLYSKGPTFHNGLFYYLSTKGKLAVLEVTGGGEEASWKEFEEPQAPLCGDYFNGFLVECDGILFSVFEGPFGKWVQVFKLNESTMTWIKVESLENYMLFVSNTSSFSVVANIPGMENKIYFPSFYGHNIVFYSLETNNYHTFKNEVVNFHHVREHLNSSWIQPRWH